MSRSRNTAARKDKRHVLVIFINERLMMLFARQPVHAVWRTLIRKNHGFAKKHGTDDASAPCCILNDASENPGDGDQLSFSPILPMWCCE
jgi:hypothetical protein